MTILTVGAGQQFSTIAGAIAASHDGDVLQVQAGTYTNDFATISTKITLQGVGGMVHMVATGNIPNDKGILITNTDVTIDHFEFSGAQGASGNDAGIRYQGGALTLTNDYFHDNQNGLLGAASASGTITIRNSEFANNGAGDGYTHNLYVGDIAKLTIDNSYFHDASVGHEIKSRAAETVITNSRIIDNGSTSSYSIDLPNGGKATLSGNVIEQGPNGGNPNIIAFGEEGLTHSVNTVTMTNNTVLNDMGKGTLLFDASGSAATVDGTRVWGLSDSQMASSSAVKVTATTHLTSEPALDTSHPWAGAASTPGEPAAITGTDANETFAATAVTVNINGGGGADTLSGGPAADTLWGGEGNDQITGAAAFDRMNGNQGDDTVRGAGGDDWVVGGKDNDQLFGDDGADIVLGNMGGDICDGGAGADLIRGGQGDDLLRGGEGGDWLSGDLGSDTVTGGGGADVFHSFAAAGLDVVTDFHLAEGDRVQLDPGTAYTLAQSGADTVVDMGAGGQMVLQNVQLASLTPGWIFAL